MQTQNISSYQHIALCPLSRRSSIPNLYFFAFGTGKRPHWQNYVPIKVFGPWKEGRKEGRKEGTLAYLSPSAKTRSLRFAYSRVKNYEKEKKSAWND